MTRAIIHTDGACTSNPGPGGFAAIIKLDGSDTITVTGGDPRTTNNQMELAAVIEAIHHLNSDPSLRDCPILVRSDSRYIVDAFNDDWVGRWQRNGWRTSKRQDVLNRDLWQRLIEETKGHPTTWQWVKGHAGDPMNEQCDHLAVAQAAVAPSADAYWVSVTTNRLDQATEHIANPATDPMRLLEAMHAALDECHTFEQFRGRMLRVMNDAEW